jgi:hypothetical protein
MVGVPPRAERLANSATIGSLSPNSFRAGQTPATEGVGQKQIGDLNANFATNRTGARTSRIADPPNGLASFADAGDSEDGGHRSGISPRPGAIERYVQENAAGLRGWKIRIDDPAATRGSSSSL